MPLALILALAVGQSPQDRTVPLVDKVGPDAVKRAAALVQLIQVARTAGGVDPQLWAAIQDAMRATPNGGAAELARNLLATNPDLARQLSSNPAVLNNLRNLAGRPTPTPPARPPTAVEPPPPPPDRPPTPPPAAPPPADEPPAPQPERMKRSPMPTVQPDASEEPPPEDGPPDRPGPPSPRIAAQAARQQRQFAAVVNWWTKNVGPIDQTPAFKGVLEQFIKGAKPGDSPLGRLLDAAAGSGSRTRGAAGWLARNLEGLAADFGGLRGAALPDAPSGMGMPSAGDASALGGPAGTAVGLIVLAGVGWWAWRTFARPRLPGWSRTGPVAAAWVDVTAVTDRESLVRAVDRLGVATFGRPAAHWHHRAVAAGLAARAPAHAAAAGDLADLYELARYAPAGDPFPADRLPAARAALAALTAGPA